MNVKNFPEIQSLEEIYSNCNASISVSNTHFLQGNKDYPAVVFSLGNKSFKLYVDDEYKDLRTDNPLLAFCLILRELENYKYENDYLEWCKSQLLDSANSQVRTYYTNLGEIYNEVEKIIGEINSHISNYDFQLNAGAAQELRKLI